MIISERTQINNPIRCRILRWFQRCDQFCSKINSSTAMIGLRPLIKLGKQWPGILPLFADHRLGTYEVNRSGKANSHYLIYLGRENNKTVHDLGQLPPWVTFSKLWPPWWNVSPLSISYIWPNHKGFINFSVMCVCVVVRICKKRTNALTAHRMVAALSRLASQMIYRLLNRLSVPTNNCSLLVMHNLQRESNSSWWPSINLLYFSLLLSYMYMLVRMKWAISSECNLMFKSHQRGVGFDKGPLPFSS